LYANLEPVIFDLVGRGRDESNFCVPWYVAGSYYDQLISSPNNRGMLRASLMECPKYSALNLRPIPTQSTVEFRHMETPTTSSDRENTLRYFRLCNALISGATNLSRAPRFLKQCLERGLTNADLMFSRLSVPLDMSVSYRGRFEAVKSERPDVVLRSQELTAHLASTLLSQLKDVEPEEARSTVETDVELGG
jgi:hypothetical protein